MLTVQGAFEDAGESKVRQYWKTLADNNISSFMIDKPYAPHITLAGIPDDKYEEFKDILPSFAEQFTSIPINMPFLAVFTSPHYVLFIGVTVTDALHHLHRELYKQHPHCVDWDLLYVPSLWIPHCTLAFQLDSSKLSSAIDACSQFPLPINTNINRLEIVESTTAEVLYSIKLKP